MGNTVVMGCKLPMGLHIGVGTKHAKLNGSNTSRIAGGYGLTDVDKELAEQWMKIHEKTGTVAAGLVFVQSTESNATAQAKDQADVKSGMEQLDPTAAVPGIETKTDK